MKPAPDPWVCAPKVIACYTCKHWPTILGSCVRVKIHSYIDIKLTYNYLLLLMYK